MRETFTPRSLEKTPTRRGFNFRRGKIIFMNNSNTIDVGIYNQCSCTGTGD